MGARPTTGMQAPPQEAQVGKQLIQVQNRRMRLALAQRNATFGMATSGMATSGMASLCEPVHKMSLLDARAPPPPSRISQPKNKFTEHINAFIPGTSPARTDLWYQHCSAGNIKWLSPNHLMVVRQCQLSLQEEGKPSDVRSALLRAYTETLDAVLYPSLLRALYQDVNEALRENNEDLLKEHGPFIRSVRAAMKSMCKHGGQNYRQGHVYRKMLLAPPVSATYQVGQVFLWPGFVSTSKDLNRTADFPAADYVPQPGHDCDEIVLFDIDLEMDDGVTYACDVSGVSKFPGEQEVVIYPYSGFKVLSREVSQDECGRSLTVIRMQTYDTMKVDLTSVKSHLSAYAGVIPEIEVNPPEFALLGGPCVVVRLTNAYQGYATCREFKPVGVFTDGESVMSILPREVAEAKGLELGVPISIISTTVDYTARNNGELTSLVHRTLEEAGVDCNIAFTNFGTHCYGVDAACAQKALQALQYRFRH